MTAVVFVLPCIMRVFPRSCLRDPNEKGKHLEQDTITVEQLEYKERRQSPYPGKKH